MARPGPAAETPRSPTGWRAGGRFVVGFLLTLLVGHALVSLGPVERSIGATWTAANVGLSAKLAGILGLEVRSVDGPALLAASGVRLDVHRGCDGVDALLVLAAAVLGFPAAGRARLWGLACGLVAVFLANAVRLSTLALIAVRWPARLDFFHIDVWQPAMTAIAFAAFAAWALRISRRTSAPGGGGGELRG